MKLVIAVYIIGAIVGFVGIFSQSSIILNTGTGIIWIGILTSLFKTSNG